MNKPFIRVLVHSFMSRLAQGVVLCISGMVQQRLAWPCGCSPCLVKAGVRHHCDILPSSGTGDSPGPQSNTVILDATSSS